ncbi:hypothetical protein FKP32DRAFT_1176855 [Trametes sanguinea]|nr:hypothetical protein FKP32DRAFT_1176855 [Trametes sanguinea]
MRMLAHCSAFPSPTQVRHPRSSSSGRRRSRSRTVGIHDFPHPSGFSECFKSIFGCSGRSVVRPLISLAPSSRLHRLLKLDVSVVFVWSETFTADDSRHSRYTYPPPVRFGRAVVRSNIASGDLSSTSPSSLVLDTPYPWCSASNHLLPARRSTRASPTSYQTRCIRCIRRSGHLANLPHPGYIMGFDKLVHIPLSSS